MMLVLKRMVHCVGGKVQHLIKGKLAAILNLACEQAHSFG